MGKNGRRYSPELKEQMVRLARSGRSARELAREFEPSQQTILNWVKQAEIDEGCRNDGLKTEREELAQLRRENARLKEEREILSKAAAWFAQETEKKSKGSSRS